MVAPGATGAGLANQPAHRIELVEAREDQRALARRAHAGIRTHLPLLHLDVTGSRVASARRMPSWRFMSKPSRFSLPSALSRLFAGARHPPETVERVDLDRLLGTWFEVARLPSLESDSPWQRAVDVTATYRRGTDGRITVQTVSYNAKAQMRRTEVNGEVQPVDASGSKLVLTFFKLIRGKLWVIGLDPEYRWALMGTPSRKRLWLIACTPRIDPADHARAMVIAAAQGYDVARVIATAQRAAA
jgi:apolipoprotein D and lipocalin family protein